MRRMAILLMLLLLPIVAAELVEKDLYFVGEPVVINTTNESGRIIIDAPEGKYRLLDNPGAEIAFVPRNPGEFSVSLLDGTGQVIEQDSFIVEQLDNPPAPGERVIRTTVPAYVGQAVMINIIPSPDGEVRIAIDSPSGTFRYFGPWSDSPFTPNVPGEHEIILLENNEVTARHAFDVVELAEEVEEPLVSIPVENISIVDRAGKEWAVSPKIKRKKIGVRNVFDVDVNLNKVGKRLHIRGVPEGERVDVEIDIISQTDIQDVTNSFAINLPFNFSNGTLTRTAQGNLLYKCATWNFAAQVCPGGWTQVREITPGQDYDIDLFPGDPAYVEIFITNAIHLDVNKTFISNIFTEVQTRDNIWSEPIGTNEYVRITFEVNLTLEKDITIFARNNQSLNTSIDVFLPNGVYITSFPIIAQTGFYKVLLTNMTSIHDTFDLRITDVNPGAYIEFDYITDPATGVQFMQPDAGAPGMNLVVQFVGDDFDATDVVTTNSSDITVGPIIITDASGDFTENNGRTLSTVFFIDASASDQDIEVSINGTALAEPFYIQTPTTNSGNFTGASGTVTIGDGNNGTRTFGGTVVLDSLIIPAGVTANIDLSDPDGSGANGNQGYLPALLVVDGPVDITGTLNVSGMAGTAFDAGGSHGGDGGPGGAGGGGGGKTGTATGGDGGDGFAGGGGSGVETAGAGGSGGAGTGATGSANSGSNGGTGGEALYGTGQEGTGGTDAGTGGNAGAGGSGSLLGTGGDTNTYSGGLSTPVGSGGGGGGGSNSESDGGGGGGFGTAGSNAVLPGTGAERGAGGAATGSANLVPIAGGSGGGGGSGDEGGNGREGGGGGGAGGSVFIFTAKNISLSGSVISSGGVGGAGQGGNGGSGGGGGSGGSIILLAPNVTITGSLTAAGGTGGASSATGTEGGNGGEGRVRVDGLGAGTNIPGSLTSEFVGPAITLLNESHIFGRAAASSNIEVIIHRGIDVAKFTGTADASGHFSLTPTFFDGTNYVTVIQNTSSNTISVMSSASVSTVTLPPPPSVHSIECYETGAGWETCANVQYSEVLDAVRIDCTPSTTNISNVTFKLENLNDATTFFENTTSDNSSGYWLFNATDLTITDSGTFRLTTTCRENPETTNMTDWDVAWGNLSGSLITPSTNGGVKQNETFTWTSRVTCTGGECGWVNATLDPVNNATIIYNTTGADNFTVPSGVSEINVKIWGAGGGGGGAHTTNAGGAGAAGGYSEANITVTPGEDLDIFIGGGGGPGIGTLGSFSTGEGGGGAGTTYINRTLTPLLLAGAGGGGGGGDNSGAGVGAGGVGGNNTAGDGGDASADTDGGGGGNQASGGTAGASVENPGTAGSSLTGGEGGDAGAGGQGTGDANNGGTGGGGDAGTVEADNFAGGGGGGAGYFGGGGGGSATSGQAGGGAGGGGSNYLIGTIIANQSGSGTTPPNTGDTHYQTGFGVGGAAGTSGGDGTTGGNGLLVITYVVKKGIIPEDSGTPFYTTSDNPQNDSYQACLADMKAGDICDTTWSVNSTGELNTTWEFFATYDSFNYSANVSSAETPHLDLTIVDSIPPTLNNIQCYETGVGWETCSNIQFGNTLDAVRANCTPGETNVSNVTFSLENLNDATTFFTNTTTDNSSGYWLFNNTDLTITDSGTFRLTTTCRENPTATDTTDWLVGWGTLSASLITPSTNGNVSQNQFFTWTSRVTCTGGECGWVNATLDPIGPTYVNSTETIVGGGTSLALTVPTGVQEDDLLIAIVANAESEDNVFTAPAGWNQTVPETQVGQTPPSIPGAEVWWKVANSSELASYTWTASFSSGLTGEMLAYRNVGNLTGDPISQTATAQSSSTGCPIAPSITTAQGNETVLYIGFTDDDEVPATEANYYPASTTGREATETASGGNGMGLGVSEELRATAGPTGTRTFQNCQAAEEWGAITISLLPSTIVDASKGAISTVAGTTPFYTTSDNPQNDTYQTCLADMKAGDICDTTWSVNSTGELNTTWEFFATYDSFNYSANVSSAETPHLNLTISTNVIPVVEYVNLTPVFVGPNTNLTCTFNVTDADSSDNVTANITWFVNDILNFTVFLDLNNGVENFTTLYSGNTSPGDNWTCQVAPYDGIVFGVAVNSSNVTILPSEPPDINQVQCQEGSSWVDCSNIEFGDTLLAVRANCTDSDGFITNVTFNLSNAEDQYTFFYNQSSYNESDWWVFNNTDEFIQDSGTFHIGVVCTDNSTAYRESTESWTVAWGTIIGTLIDPTTASNVTKNKFFNFTSNVTCLGGECGDINATLDPIPGWWNASFAYRQPVTITENSNNNLTGYQFNFTIDTATIISANKMETDCDDMRFVDNTSRSLPFHIDSGCNSATTLIWVNGSLNAFTNTIIYFYYGNNTVTSGSDPEGTYFIYENMSAAPKGSIIGDAAYVDQQTGVRLTSASGNLLGYLYYLKNPGPGFAGTYMTWAGGGSGADSTWFGVHDDSVSSTREDIVDGGYHFTVDEWQDRNAWTKSTTDNGAPIASFSDAGLDDSTWHKMDVFFYNNGTEARGDLWWDGVNRISATDSSPQATTGPYFLIGGRTGGSTNEHRVNNITIRKWVYPEPNVTYGIETPRDKGIIPMNSGSPFYTMTDNPMNSSFAACLADMSAGDTCTTEWAVNATGEINIPFEFFVTYNSFNYSSVIANLTPKVNITIIENVAPNATNVIIAPDFALPTTDLTCNFTIIDVNTFDSLSANVSWYVNGTFNFSVLLNVTNGNENVLVLDAGNTTNGDTWICGVTPIDEDVYGAQVNSTNATITLILPPTINEIQCYENNSIWTACSNLQFGDTFSGVRTNCTSASKVITNMTFNFTNVPDGVTYFENTTTLNETDWWIFYENVTINNSGDFNVYARCEDNESAIDIDSVTWNVAWGYLVGILITPDSDVDVESNQFFTFTSNVTCLGGECGNVNATLDPKKAGENTYTPVAAHFSKGGNAAYPSGLSTVNSLRDTYDVGETATILIVALDKDGELTPGDFILTVTTANGNREMFTPGDTRRVSPGTYSVEYGPVQETGTYSVKLQSITEGIVDTQTTSFNVAENPRFTIERGTPTAINPWYGPFTSTIYIQTDEEYTLTETLPGSFVVLEAKGATVWQSQNTTLLVWNDLSGNAEVSYTVLAPKVSPERYELRASLSYKGGIYDETRPWVIAADPANYYSASSDVLATDSDGGFTEADGGDFSDTVVADCSGGTCTSSNSWVTGFQNFANGEPYDCEMNATLSFNVSDLNPDYIQNLTIDWGGCWHGDENLGANNCDNGDNPEFDDGTGGGSFNMRTYTGSSYSTMTCVDVVGSECGAGNEINLGTDAVAPSWDNADDYNNFRFETSATASYVVNDLINITWRVFGTNVCGDSDADDDILMVIDYATLTVGWEYLIKSGMVSTTVGDEPFYTTDANPQNFSQASCLEAMLAGDTCQVTWQVNATGGIDTTHEFFVDYNSTQYPNDVTSNDTTHIDITIRDTSQVAPVVTLNIPTNNAWLNNSAVDFNCSATDNSGLVNITLYGNFTNGTFMENETQTLSGVADSAAFTKTISDGTYKWNCLAYDTNANTDWGTANFTFHVDTEKPTVELAGPSAGQSFFVGTVQFNFTTTDNLDPTLSCNLTINNTVVDSGFSATSGALTNRQRTGLVQSFYLWNVTCIDEAGNSNTSETRNFTVAELPPSVFLTTANNTFFGTPNVTLSFNSTDNNNVTLAYLYVNDVFNQTMVDPIDYTIETFTVYDLIEGFYNWTVNVSDISNLSEIATEYYFVVDLTSPNVTLSTPVNNSNLTNGEVQFNFTAVDTYSPNMTCNLSINATLVVGGITTFNDTLTTQAYNVTDGNHTWSILCEDLAGNQNVSETWVFNISAPPIIVLNSPDDNHSQSSQNIELNYTPYDNTGLDTCTLILNGVNNATDTTMSNGVETNFTLTGLPFGNYNWTVQCNDTFGIAGIASPVRHFVLDGTDPFVNLSAPFDGQVINGTSVEFNFTAYDGVDTSLLCDFTLDDVVNKTGLVAPNGTEQNFTLVITNDGLHYWNITCIDDASNTNTSSTWNFTTQNPPEITLVSPINDSVLGNGTDINFTFLALDGDGVLNASLIVDNIRVQDNQSPIVPVNNYILYTLTDGVYYWTINATDTIGLEGTIDAFKLTVDTTRPNITYNQPAEDEVMTSNNVTFNFTVVDNLDDSLICNLTINEITTVTNITVANNTAYVNTSTLPDGSYNWSASCIDHANNTNTYALINFTVVAPPDVTLHFPTPEYRNNIQNVTFNYTPIDALGFQNCTLLINGTANLTDENIEKNEYNYFNPSNFTDGAYNWTVLCIDESPDENPFAPPNITFYVDLTGPVITLLSPAEAATLNNNSVIFNWSAVDFNSSVVITCNITLDDVVNQTNIIDFSGENFNTTILNLTDGEHNWSVACVDDLGNLGTSVTGNFTINQADLFLNETLITFNDTNPSLGDTVNITANVSNLGGIVASNVNVSFWDNGVFIDGDIRTVPFNTSLLFNVSWIITPGFHTIFVSADPLGTIDELNETNNNGTTNISAIYANITLPLNNTITEDTTPQFSFNLSDWTGNNLTYRFYVDGAYNGQSGNVTDLTENSINLTALTDGIHLVLVEGEDYLGRRKNSTTITITIDTTSPSTEFITANASWYDVGTMTINFNITDQFSTNINFTAYLDGILNHTNTTITGSLANATFVGVPEGRHELIIQASDELNNTGNSTIFVFYVDLTPPEPNITTANESWYNETTPGISFNITDNLDDVINYTFYVDGVKDHNGTVNNATEISADLLPTTEGTHTIILEGLDEAGNARNSTPIVIYVDLTHPLVTLLSPYNDTNLTSTQTELNFTVSDNMAGTLICNVTLDSSVVDPNIVVTNGTNYSTPVSDLSSGIHYWNVTCADLAGNYNISETWLFRVETPDLTITAGNITFSNSTPIENQSIQVNATIFNIGQLDAINVTVQFWLGDPDFGGIQIDINQTIPRLNISDNITVNVSHYAIIGLNQIFVVVDPLISLNGSIDESNETNNKANLDFYVGLFHVFAGGSINKLEIADSSILAAYAWNVSNTTGSNVFVTDSDSSITFTELYGIARNITNGTYVDSNDFEEIDDIMNTSSLNDSINNTFTLDGNIHDYMNITAFKRNIIHIPVINSTNTTAFRTGILWDASDTNPGYYNGSQDIAFVTVMNESQVGKFGTYDYEITIPATLRDYIVGGGTITFYTELR